MDPWVIFDAGAIEDDALAWRIRADLAGPGRTLSAATRREYLTWERAWRAHDHPSAVRKSLGFAPDEGN